MRRTVYVAALLLILAGTGRGEIEAVKVKAGEAPTIDGVLAEGEWTDALHVELKPAGEAWLRHDAEALYVAVRVGQNCIPSLALFHEQTVRILHASASLGTAEYAQEDGAWQAVRGFTWQCRDGQTTDADRQRFLEAEGWVATTCGVGRRGEAEYRIERSLLTDETPRLAIVACRLQPMPFCACAWPSTVDDGTRDQDLLMGHTPDVSFDPGAWARLDLGVSKDPAATLEQALARLERLAASTPVEAYLELLAFLDAQDPAAARDERVKRLRSNLERKKEVQAERSAQRRLDKALQLARKKLREVETKHPGTRAAARAAALREDLSD